MVKKSVIYRIELKCERWIRKTWPKLLKETKRFIIWLFAYDYKNDMGDLIQHIVTVLAWLYIGVRLMQGF